MHGCTLKFFIWTARFDWIKVQLKSISWEKLGRKLDVMLILYKCFFQRENRKGNFNDKLLQSSEYNMCKKKIS